MSMRIGRITGFWVTSIAVALAAAACSGSGTGTTGAGAGTPGTTSGGAGGNVQLPPDAMCDVLTMLNQKCWACHGTKLHDKAPMSLVTLADLKAPSAFDPAQSNAERAAARVVSAMTPMPPSAEPTVDAKTAATLKAWVAAGYPEASCGDVAKDPFAAAAKCSGKLLPDLQEAGDEMYPGQECNTCHTQINSEEGGDAPIFLVAGTIFKTAHEPDNCGSDAAEGAEVEVIDAKGKSFLMKANATGNFHYEEHDIEFPYTARVVFEGRERVMIRPQTDGACNTCHTQDGKDDAPGRILLP